MDIILEIWDTFIGDRLYSTLLPASLSSSISLPAFVNAAANTSMALFGPEPFVYEQATQMIKELRPDFIFIDINMPRYDGINCLKKLKEMEPLRHSTFVMYSTYISEDNHEKAMQLGADQCIHKPENIRILLKQLVRLFNDKAHPA